jgi:hypothetical protein
MHKECILMHMRTTLILKDDLLEKAMELTGIHEKTALIHKGLEMLIAQENRKRLMALAGTQRDLRVPPRRRGRPGK